MTTTSKGAPQACLFIYFKAEKDDSKDLFAVKELEDHMESMNLGKVWIHVSSKLELMKDLQDVDEEIRKGEYEIAVVALLGHSSQLQVQLAADTPLSWGAIASCLAPLEPEYMITLTDHEDAEALDALLRSHLPTLKKLTCSTLTRLQ
jgi:hypothetical protein